MTEIRGTTWDVIVIGAGMGGGMAGRRLAEAGLSVLFVETGPEAPREDARDWTEEITDPGERRARGYWPEPIHGTVDGTLDTFYGSLGTGVGGTSAFYAATLERPARHDLDDSPALPHPTGGWPVGHEAFRPYFALAEDWLQVCGDADPLDDEPAPTLRTAPPLSAGDTLMMETFRRVGLHPYRKHVGVRYLPGCEECFGRKCARACKMDGRSAGVEPARATGRAAVLDDCEVVALRGTAAGITHLEARRHGEALTLTAGQFLLAAGALGSPRLLLASASEDWPEGCGNGAGLVGRNLMFHLNERIAIWPEQKTDFTGPINTISIRDFYLQEGTRYGHLQSMGISASYGTILHTLRERFDRSYLAPLRPLRPLLRFPAMGAARLFGNARIFVGILEDLPYAENRVIYDPAHPSRIIFDYHVMPELVERRAAFRSAVKAGLGPQRSFFLDTDPVLNSAHSCGTLRFGTDPATSVLDADCRVHGIPNLHVADASFMPTSTGINPSLTIAANAIRVADRLLARQSEFERPRQRAF